MLATLDGIQRCWCARATCWASSFHPELTPDRRVHGLFARICAGADDPDAVLLR